MTLKQQLYIEFANKSLVKLRSEMRKKHKAKKDGRFSVNDITYEIGVALTENDTLSFDISSKVPLELLPPRSSKDRFFKLVQKQLNKGKIPPESVDIDNILSRQSTHEVKERDYIKVVYRYEESELFSEKEILKKIEEIKKSKKALPMMAGVNSTYGKLILMTIEEAIYKKSNENITLLINSNNDTLKQYNKKKK